MPAAARRRIATTGTISLRASASRRRASMTVSSLAFDARKRSMTALRRRAEAVVPAAGARCATAVSVCCAWSCHDAAICDERAMSPASCAAPPAPAGDEPGGRPAAAGLGEQRALDAAHVDPAGAVRLEEAPVAGQDVAAQA